MNSSSVRRIRDRLARTPLRGPLVWSRHRALDHRDVVLASYPRSGNTWLRFLLFQLLEGRSVAFSELDAPDSAAGRVESAAAVPRALPGNGRLLKTHEPWRREYARAIYLLRDIRAVAVSEYRFLRWRGLFTGELEEFVDRFERGRVNPFGSWVSHYESWRESPLVATQQQLFVRYEELREHSVRELGRIVAFLGLEADPIRLQEVLADNTVERLQAREDSESDPFYKSADSAFRLVNRGLTRGWRDDLSESQIGRLTELGRSVDDWSGYD